jgi:hypothetical protein
MSVAKAGYRHYQANAGAMKILKDQIQSDRNTDFTIDLDEDIFSMPSSSLLDWHYSWGGEGWYGLPQ